jgi:serine/threonine-protein phosphatase 5
LNVKIEDFENFDLETIKVESDYKGPVYEKEEDMTPEFCEKLVEWHKDQKKLPKKYLWGILKRILKQFKSLDSLVDVEVTDDVKITVCGDTHGQYYDLCNIFKLNGMPSETNPYLFNGDFVDRGSFSVEVIVTMLAFKCCYPNHFHMTRGNHETKNMNELYGFQGEVTAKYDTKTYEFFTEIFNWLPLSYVLNSSTGKKVFITHGGLFDTTDVTLDMIRKVERNRQPPESGIMTDALWADPCMLPGRRPSKRGTSIQFGPNITEQFCEKNGLEYIIRSHEVKQEGYEEAHNKRCYTIFSAPNYCDQMGNQGAYIHIQGPDLKPKFNQFDAVPHPHVKPMQFSNPLLRLAGLM